MTMTVEDMIPEAVKDRRERRSKRGDQRAQATAQAALKKQRHQEHLHQVSFLKHGSEYRAAMRRHRADPAKFPLPKKPWALTPEEKAKRLKQRTTKR